jgi:cytochrome b pre-mRNA-processing protein 3
MLKRLLRPRAADQTGEALYGLVAAQARRPEFYTRLGVADRIDARFELYTLHVLLLVLRLRAEGEAGAEIGQALFDAYVSSLDNVLRELGVGDVAVGKKMRKLGEALYGRMTAYEGPLRTGDETIMAEALGRNVYEDAGIDAAPLARYALACRDRLAHQPVQAVIAAPDWAELV